MIMTLDNYEGVLISGGSCYGAPCKTCEELYLGDASGRSECEAMCASTLGHWCKYFSYYNPANCNHSCLGSCWTKCDFHPLGVIEAMSGSGTDWRKLCKSDCYKKCNC